MRLIQFAFYNNEKLADLEALAAEEVWGDGNSHPYATLHYYCEANFEIAYAQGHIYVDPAKRFAVWRVGSLISKDSKPIYAYFTKNTFEHRQEYRLNRFLTGSWDGPLAVSHGEALRDLPRMQEYPIEKFQHDFRIEADDWDHLLNEHEIRLRKVLPGVEQHRVWQLILSGAFEEVQRLSRFAENIIPQYYIPRFREFAQPPYFQGSYQYLAPLYLKEQPGPDKTPDLVAPLERNNMLGVYIVKTLLPPEWAYRTARCLARENTRLRPWLAAPRSNNGQPPAGLGTRAERAPQGGKSIAVKPGKASETSPAPKQPQAGPAQALVQLPSEPETSEALAVSQEASITVTAESVQPPTSVKTTPISPDPETSDPAAIDPDEALTTVLTPWLECAKRDYKAGQYTAVILACDQAIQQDAKNADAHCLKGDALRQLGENESAVDAYQKAYNSNPRLPSAFLGAGRVYHRMANYRLALIAYDEAIHLTPNAPYAYAFKSQSLTGLNYHEEALKALERALELKPNYAFAWYLKGETLTRLERLDEAQQAFQTAKNLGYNQ